MADTKAVAHTPLPWRTLSNGRDAFIEHVNDSSGQKRIAFMCLPVIEREANAALIVRAVNCHQELVDALKECIDELTANPNDGFTLLTLQRAESAIRRAEGKEQEDGYADADTVRP